MRPLVLIKIGGGLITDKTKPLTVREDMLQAAAEGLRQAFKTFPDNLYVVGNGAGSFGHYVASQKHTIGPKERIRAIHESVLKLNAIFREHLNKVGISTQTVIPADCITAQDGSLVAFDMSAIEQLLEKSIVPLIFGDIVDDGTERGMIFSTESLLEILAEKLRTTYAPQVLYVGEAPGVLSADGKVIPEISSESWKDMGNIIEAPVGYDVTGGMQHKVESALKMATMADSVRILSGKDPQNISAALGGADIGTKIVA